MNRDEERLRYTDANSTPQGFYTTIPHHNDTTTTTRTPADHTTPHHTTPHRTTPHLLYIANQGARTANHNTRRSKRGAHWLPGLESTRVIGWDADDKSQSEHWRGHDGWRETDYYDDDGGGRETEPGRGSGGGDGGDEGGGDGGDDGGGDGEAGGGSGNMEVENIHSSHQLRKVMVGERFRLKCRPENLVNAQQQDFTAVWYFKSERLEDLKTPRIRITAPSRPIINKELSNMTVVQGSEVKLMCSVISDLVPYITWVKHSTRFNGVDDKGNIINRLFIVKVKVEVFVEVVVLVVVVVVVVVVVLGVWSLTNPRLLTLEHIPSRPIITKHLENITAYVGDKVELKVDIWTENTLMPYVVWKRDLPFTWSMTVWDKTPQVVISPEVLTAAVAGQEGRNITSSEDPQVLILSNVTERDAGWYTCIAANSLGTSFSTAYLSVIDAEPKMHDPEYHAIMVLTVVLLSVMIIGSIVASFVWKKWQKEKRRAIELERAKAITQHWIKKDYLNLSLPHLDTPPSSCGSSLTSDILSPH
ncbi:Fibroblast growth factor receptor 4 [Portunus trituberculatus]|uniref:receptor protein-tyrosine kinase n=1 Tax=Portunus trituberculatus TaxID=210409 RepID=A0A5B7CH53_PORTR|nr:Fibroblast growth factor receptor 4 [Portunus trituberculatus]